MEFDEFQQISGNQFIWLIELERNASITFVKDLVCKFIFEIFPMLVAEILEELYKIFFINFNFSYIKKNRFILKGWHKLNLFDKHLV